MDDLVRDIVNEKGAWGARDSDVLRAAVDLDDAWAARLVALLVERAGGRVAFERRDIGSAGDRIALFVYATEEGLALEARRLATGG